MVGDMVGGGGRAGGDGDDDLDFDPFKETQKAFAELMETEMMQNTVSSGYVKPAKVPQPHLASAKILAGIVNEYRTLRFL